jgi:hypothetical protein
MSFFMIWLFLLTLWVGFLGSAGWCGYGFVVGMPKALVWASIIAWASAGVRAWGPFWPFSACWIWLLSPRINAAALSGVSGWEAAGLVPAVVVGPGALDALGPGAVLVELVLGAVVVDEVVTDAGAR